MGGHAIKTARRHAKDEFEAASVQVLSILQKYFSRVEFPLILPSKQDFGDLDCLVCRPEGSIDSVVANVEREFSSNQVVKNGDVVSFEFNGLQVDLIFVPAANFDFYKVYSSYGDLGNLMGILANRHGLKFGGKGLEYRVLVADDITRDIGGVALCMDPHAVFAFLGYSFDRWLQGFATELEVFEFVASSPLFNSAYYAEDHCNHRERDRHKKRPMFIRFVQFLQDNPDRFPPRDEKASLRQLALQTFGAEETVAQMLRTYELIQSNKVRFNGKLVRQVTGLRDKEMGEFIDWIKLQHQPFEEWLAALAEEDVKSEVAKAYEVFRTIPKADLVRIPRSRKPAVVHTAMSTARAADA